MLRALLVLVVMVVGGVARADDRVALLPLDTEPRLEIYGQPVASEVARAIRAAKIEIEVIGAKMAVPENAKLIVDGTIAAGKPNKNDIVLTLRIRNPVDGVVLATVTSTAVGIANIDKAASEVSARLMTVLQERLAAVRPTTKPDPTVGTVPVRQPATPPEMRPLLVAVTMHDASSEGLRAALTTQLDAQLRAVFRTPQVIEPAKLSRELATKTVKEGGLDLGMLFEITSYTIDMRDGVPMVRANVRMRVTDAVGIVFDRVIITDTIVGEKGISREALAQRVAREVLDIARPHLRRTVRAWR